MDLSMTLYVRIYRIPCIVCMKFFHSCQAEDKQGKNRLRYSVGLACATEGSNSKQMFYIVSTPWALHAQRRGRMYEKVRKKFKKGIPWAVHAQRMMD